jgi:hypothetical protein
MANVEILCKNPLISLCKINEQKCAKNHRTTSLCVKTHFFAHFFTLLHQLPHQPFSPISNQSFPLFHSFYNYNYNNYLIERN